MNKHTPYKILCILAFNLYLVTGISAQKAEIAFLGGFSNYIGDLQQKPFVMDNAGGVVGITYKHPLSSKLWLRAGITNSKLTGTDANNEASLVIRNLSFETKITDGYIAAEYRLFSEERAAIIPYVFLGIGMFSFDPYTLYGDKNEKVYLQPLGTEGQGLPEYPDRKMYKLEQFMFPLGGGILWHANEQWTLGLEGRFNLTFTDYLDDVSSTYALPGPLLRDRGQLALDVAWRRDEIDNRPYPTNQATRGNPAVDDMYYYIGFNVGFKLPNSGLNGKPSYKNGLNQLGCPKW
jgi:Domain of unknown function (DUF6089)